MRRVLVVIGAIVVFIGAIWFLQGIDVLPGSFMSGQPRWAVNGTIASAVGLLLIIASRWRSRR